MIENQKKKNRGILRYNEEKGWYTIGSTELKNGDVFWVCTHIGNNDWMVYDFKIKQGDSGWYIEDFSLPVTDFLGKLCVIM